MPLEIEFWSQDMRFCSLKAPAMPSLSQLSGTAFSASTWTLAEMFYTCLTNTYLLVLISAIACIVLSLTVEYCCT